VRKRIVLPEEAVPEYAGEIERVRRLDLRGVAPPHRPGAATLIRLHGDAEPLDIRFDPALVLPAGLERLRTSLEDLLRVIASDREVTARLVGFQPKLGDRLIAEDQRVFKVTQLIDNKTVAELTCVDSPVRIYVAISDLHRHFIGVVGVER
jgi:hypothetical protein